MNIVLVCLDTFRADCVGARGLHESIRTPNIDRLVREGVLFENAFGEGQPTMPFRRAIWTGRRSFPFNRPYDTTGLWPSLPGWHKIPPEQPTLAEMLLDAGYATAWVSSAYHTFKPTVNFGRGFAAWEYIRGHEADPWKWGNVASLDLERWARQETLGDRAPSAFIQYLLNNADRRGPEDYIPARLFSRAIDYVRSARDGRPFFLLIDSFSPHDPWDPPREYADAYDPDWDEDWLPIYCHRSDCREKTARRVRAQYYGEITHVDTHLGRLLEALDDEGLTDDTLVWVCSDHGAELWDHGEARKLLHGARYRHNTEIACLARFPGGEHAGARVSPFVLSHDIPATLLDASGAPHPPLEGRSLLPLIRGESPPWRDHIVTGWSCSRANAVVRTADYAYSCDAMAPAGPTLSHDGEADATRHSLAEHLFDVKEDPGETRNLAAERSSVTAEYRAKLEAYLGGPLPYRWLVAPKRYAGPFEKMDEHHWAPSARLTR